MSLLVLALMAAPDARAQTVHLAELLPNLILREIVLPVPRVDIPHAVHFSPIESNDLDNPAVGIVQNFNKLMMVQLSTFPLGSSAGGFTYRFDESLGTFRRESSSFGPAFAERAVTIGRRKVSAGVTYQHTRYGSFEGQTLDDGSIKVYLRHKECCTPGGGSTGTGTSGGGGRGGGGPVEVPDGSRLSPTFEGDLIQAALSLKATTDTMAFFGNYGVTDRWDVSVVVPLVRVELDASIRATILRLATVDNPELHSFEAGNSAATQKTFSQSGTATGLGDVLVRTKYHVMRFAGGGLAGAVDIRLPTGDQKDLLGAGTQVKTLLIASRATGRFAEHINVGYTASSGNVKRFGLLSALGADEPLPHELNYAAGFEVVVEPRVTVVGDVVGRALRDAGRLEVTSKPFVYQGPVVQETARFDEFDPRPGNLNLVLGTVGVKFNPVRDLLVSAHVLFPLTDSGLRSRLTTVIGLDYAF